MITIIHLTSSDGRQQQSVYHVSQEVSFLCLTEVRHTHMRQHLLLQYFTGVFHTLLTADTRARSTGTDEVQSNVLFLYHEGFIQRGFYLNKYKRTIFMKLCFSVWHCDTCLYSVNQWCHITCRQHIYHDKNNQKLWFLSARSFWQLELILRVNASPCQTRRTVGSVIDHVIASWKPLRPSPSQVYQMICR